MVSNPDIKVGEKVNLWSRYVVNLWWGPLVQVVIWQTVKPSFSHLKKMPLSYYVVKDNLNKIYILLFKATNEVKLRIFQQIVHSNLAKNSILYKIRKVASPSSPLCISDSQNKCHLFISCLRASSFWDKFQSWYSTVSNAKLLLSEPRVLFGI